jgi:hypothetical protein
MRPPKPIVTEVWVVASEDPGRLVYLCRTARGTAVTAELSCALRFDEWDEAEAARRDYVDRHRSSHHGPQNWRVLHATTRTTFRGPD